MKERGRKKGETKEKEEDTGKDRRGKKGEGKGKGLKDRGKKGGVGSTILELCEDQKQR